MKSASVAKFRQIKDGRGSPNVWQGAVPSLARRPGWNLAHLTAAQRQVPYVIEDLPLWVGRGGGLTGQRHMHPHVPLAQGLAGREEINGIDILV